MTQVYVSLVTCLAMALVAPFMASLVRGRAVPEVVFLVFGGAILGSHGLRLINPQLAPVEAISDLGMGFLFLKAGYEIDPRDLVGRMGRVASASWLVSLGLGFLVTMTVFAGLGFSDSSSWPALAIIMTTTGYGTLAPIMEERGLQQTSVGRVVTIYGSLGELLPIVAMSFLLSTRATGRTVAALLVFALVCFLVLAFSRAAKRAGTRFWRFLQESTDALSQPMMRVVSLLLVFLLLATAIFRFDGVLGAFAAGFILRALFPEGNPELEGKIGVISNGFFQPIFFVVSGAALDLSAATQNLPLLLAFIASLAVVRGVVVGVTLRIDPETRRLSWKESLVSATYCTMALPLVVAVSNIAVASEVMSATEASVLIIAAAVTVVVVPVVTALARVVDEFGPSEAFHGILHDEHGLREALHESVENFHRREAAYHERLHAAREKGQQLSSAVYLAMPEGALDLMMLDDSGYDDAGYDDSAGGDADVIPSGDSAIGGAGSGPAGDVGARG